MFEGCLVENEDVGEGCDYEVDESASQPGFVRCGLEGDEGGLPHDEEEREELAVGVISRQLACPCCVSRCEGEVFAGGRVLPC